jgi:hypothetical protein
MFLIPPPPAPLTRDERLSIGRMLALSAWRKMPETLRRHARFDSRAAGDDLRLLLDLDTVQSVALVANEDCLDRDHIAAAVLDAVRLVGLS